MQEKINTLFGNGEIKIIQRQDMFNFSLDSILLADFVNLTKDAHTLVDLGTGFAPIPLFLSTRSKTLDMLGIEIQREVADIARRNVALNNLEPTIRIINGDLRDESCLPARATIDIVTCNPPFFKHDVTSNLNKSTYKTIARHEVTVTMEDIVRTAAYLLKQTGRLFMVIRAMRTDELIHLFKTYDFHTKRMRFVHTRENKEASMVLIEATYRTNPGLRILPPLYVHDAEGYTDEVDRIYKRK